MKCKGVVGTDVEIPNFMFKFRHNIANITIWFSLNIDLNIVRFQVLQNAAIPIIIAAFIAKLCAIITLNAHNMKDMVIHAI